jgi:hypothetical protein
MCFIQITYYALDDCFCHIFFFPPIYWIHLFHHCTIIVLFSHLTPAMSPLYFVVAHSNNIIILLQKVNEKLKNKNMN